MGDPAKLEAKFYLRETMNKVISEVMERQVGALGLKSLLNELLDVVLDLHSVISSSSFVAERSCYTRIKEIYGCLCPVLDKVLSYAQPGAEAEGNLCGRLVSLNARRRFCVATTRELKTSLASLKESLGELRAVWLNSEVWLNPAVWLNPEAHHGDDVEPLVGRDRLLQEMMSIIRGKYFWGNWSYVPPWLMQQLCTKSTTATWVDPSDNEALPPLRPPLVFTVAGGPGVGKTTLAKVIYDVGAFDVKCWTRVSEIFDPNLILTALLESCYLEYQSDESLDALAGDVRDALIGTSLDALAEDVRDALIGKRYLLVLDDVWTTDAEQWEKLKHALPPTTGSTVIVTTRITAVASCAANVWLSILPYFIEPLDQNASLSLLLQTITRTDGPLPHEPWVAQVATTIAEKCGGVPFLLKHVGELLSRRQVTETEWRGFLSEFQGFPEEALLTAFPSYWRLAPHLQRCLRYCSAQLLSDDYFDAETLSSILVREGLMPSTLTDAQLTRSLKQLLGECFYPMPSSFPFCKDGFKITYRMHHMLRIVALHHNDQVDNRADRYIWYALLLTIPQQTSPKQYLHFEDLNTLVLNVEKDIWSTDQRCDITEIPQEFCLALRARLQGLSLQGFKIKTFPKNLELLDLIHLDLSCTDIETIPSSVSKMKFLQILKLAGCGKLEILDEHIGNLVQLKEINLEGCNALVKLPNLKKLNRLEDLNLSWTGIKKIPSSFCRLQSLRRLKLSHCKKLHNLNGNTLTKLIQLQHLKLKGCHCIAVLPRNMSKMESLVYLNVLECSSLIQMPHRLSQLTRLETLLGYVVADKDRCNISELCPLLNLSKLCLERLDKVLEIADVRAVKMQGKTKLESLSLRWNVDAETTAPTAHDVLQELKPHNGLEVLEIVSYNEKMLPSWLESSDPYLNSLVEIKLINLKACKTLPPLGLLRHLKIADITGAEAIERIDHNFYGRKTGTFPSLKKLTFSCMPKLEVWKGYGEGAFPVLAEVVIIQCPILALEVLLPSVEKLILVMDNKKLYHSKGSLRAAVPNLQYILVSFCEDFGASSDCMGLKDLQFLKVLEICGCGEMVYPPASLGTLSSLRSIEIDNCRKLERIPDWLIELKSLRSLCLSGCPALQYISEGRRVQLNMKIYVEDCPKLLAQSSAKYLPASVYRSNLLIEKVSKGKEITESSASQMNKGKEITESSAARMNKGKEITEASAARMNKGKEIIED